MEKIILPNTLRIDRIEGNVIYLKPGPYQVETLPKFNIGDHVIYKENVVTVVGIYYNGIKLLYTLRINQFEDDIQYVEEEELHEKMDR